MNWLEIGLAFVSNLRILFVLFGLISTVVICITLIAHLDEDEKSVKKHMYLKQCLFFIVLTMILFSLSCIPNVNELWKVRIGLIKLEMASPENVKSGVEVIERVGRELECKYLSNDCVTALEKKAE